MARTPVGGQLTDLHRITQARIATELTATLLPLWRILDLDNLDATADAWVAAAISAIESSRASSISTTGAYLRAFRMVEVPQAAPFDLPPAPALNRTATATSLLVSGPIALKSKIGGGMPLRTAVSQSFAGSSLSAARHALNGGRYLAIEMSKTDPRSKGLIRITSPGACTFCKSSGSEALAPEGSNWQWHDGCNCQPEPVFT